MMAKDVFFIPTNEPEKTTPSVNWPVSHLRGMRHVTLELLMNFALIVRSLVIRRDILISRTHLAVVLFINPEPRTVTFVALYLRAKFGLTLLTITDLSS